MFWTILMLKYFFAWFFYFYFSQATSQHSGSSTFSCLAHDQWSMYNTILYFLSQLDVLYVKSKSRSKWLKVEESHEWCAKKEVVQSLISYKSACYLIYNRVFTINPDWFFDFEPLTSTNRMTSKPRRLRIKRPRCCFTAWPSSGRWAAKGKKKQTAHPSFPFSLTLWWSARPTAAASGCSRRTEGRLMFISLTLMIPGTTGGILYWPIPITVKLTCLVVSQGRTGLGEEEEEKKAMNDWMKEKEHREVYDVETE